MRHCGCVAWACRNRSGAGDVVFGSTVDSSGNGETGNLAVSDYHSLTVEAGTGSVAFNGALGGKCAA